MFCILGELFEKLAFLKSIYFRGFIAFIFSFLAMLVVGKPFIDKLKRKKFGEKIREDGPATHFSKKGTPTMGGLLIIVITLITALMTADLTDGFIILLIVTMLLFAGIGFVDDYRKFTVSKKGLSGKKKLLGQGTIALLVWLYILFFGLTGDKVVDFSILNPLVGGSYIYLGSFGMLALIVLVVMGTSNAVNITDGLDGLATMPVIICTAVLSIIAYFTGHIEISKHLNLYYISNAGEITVFLAAIMGSSLGFLWYNFYPAQIFMGDTGSLALGGIIGVVAILLRQELLLPLIGGVFVVEALSVILQVGSFKLRGKRIF